MRFNFFDDTAIKILILDFSLEKLLSRSYSAKAIFKPKNIVIHEEYVRGIRDQADIALVEVDREIEFVDGKVGPICLPPPEYKDKDHDVQAFVLGWGLLYEEDNRKESEASASGHATCMTTGDGPSKYRPCRSRFLHLNDVEYVNADTGCVPDSPPVTYNEECNQLVENVPDAKYKTTLIRNKNGNNTICPPLMDAKNSSSWCATYVASAKSGEPGFYDPELAKIDDMDFDFDEDTPDDVTVDAAWGFCDRKCFETTENLKANVLQQVALTVLDSEHCHLMTASNEDISYRAKVDRELCAAKETDVTTIIFEKKGGKYEKVDKKTEKHWGGSDSCQVRLKY